MFSYLNLLLNSVQQFYTTLPEPEKLHFCCFTYKEGTIELHTSECCVVQVGQFNLIVIEQGQNLKPKAFNNNFKH